MNPEKLEAEQSFHLTFFVLIPAKIKKNPDMSLIQLLIVWHSLDEFRFNYFLIKFYKISTKKLLIEKLYLKTSNS